METSNFSGKNSSLPNNSSKPPWAILDSTSFASLDPSSKDLVTRSFAPRIKIIALHLKAKLPAHIELSDLVSAGALGLMEALGKFQSTVGVRFETFAENRIRGAMLDELRRMDWFSRGLRQKIKKLEQVIRDYEQEHGQAPTRQDLEQITGQNRAELENILEALNSQMLLSLDNLQENFISDEHADDHGEPAAIVARQDIIDKLAGLINTLKEREQLVLSLYYTEELNMKEVALTLGLTEGRVSQIHSQALAKLKKMFIQRHGAALV